MMEDVEWTKGEIIKKQIVLTWSGGIDSTALIAQLLKKGYEVFAFRFNINIYGSSFEEREKRAIKELLPKLQKIGKIHFKELEGDFLFNFSPDGKEIPRRNRFIIDSMLETQNKPRKIYNIGLGEYIGADTWVVQDHVGGADADHRALSAYIYNEYGLSFRFWSLADFGESRFKHNRVKLGTDILGEDMFLTTNCLEDGTIHCGECYKCIERNIAFIKILGNDSTEYISNPKENKRYDLYLRQMNG